MLVNKDIKNRNYTTYTCDRCKTVGNRNTINKIYKADKVTGTVYKQWDLCDDCYKALERGIKKGKA